MRKIPPVVILGLLLSLASLGGGAQLLFAQQMGTPAKATVTECYKARRIAYCHGTWVAGGALVGGGGHVVIGTIEGAGPDDLGKTLDVRLSGDRAYSTSLRLPIILVGLSLTCGALAGIELRKHMRSAARPS